MRGVTRGGLKSLRVCCCAQLFEPKNCTLTFAIKHWQLSLRVLYLLGLAIATREVPGAIIIPSLEHIHLGQTTTLTVRPGNNTVRRSYQTSTPYILKDLYRL
jgi:hypothetical protein